MKWNLFKKKPEAMVGPEPTGLGGTHPPSTMTMAPGPALSTTADNSTESGGSSMDDIFEKIRNKFLNEIETIPCKFIKIYFLLRYATSLIFQLAEPAYQIQRADQTGSFPEYNTINRNHTR